MVLSKKRRELFPKRGGDHGTRYCREADDGKKEIRRDTESGSALVILAQAVSVA